MIKTHLNHTIVGYFLTLKPEANVQEFERFLSAQEPGENFAPSTLSKALNGELVYLWTVRIGENDGVVDRGGRPLILDGVLARISRVSRAFPVEIKEAFWCPVQTPEALIGEFNKLPGMLIKFAAAAS